MLKSVVPLLVCPNCKQDDALLNAHTFKESDQEIIDGFLQCSKCRAYYPILDRLLDLVTSPLLDIAALDIFEQQYSKELKSRGYRRPKDAGVVNRNSKFTEQMKQRMHFDAYAEGVKQRYDDYSNMPFWCATDAWTFERWQDTIKPGEMLLDVGCADGRSSFPHLPRNVVVGFDISRKMIRSAIDKALPRGWQGRFSFFVADGSSLPFKNASFYYVQTYGVLHHLPSPGSVVRDIQRVLKPGGIHFASENNATPFRRIFDQLMKIMPIWHEEAGEEALISRAMAEEWITGLPALIISETIVYLPPHLFNLFSARSAKRLLDATNRVFGAIPGLSQNGGLIVFQIQKAVA